MLYSPEFLGRMRVGCFLDAMIGYNEGENERIKSLAEIVRRATNLIWNTQIVEEDRCGPADMWPFAWDKKEEEKPMKASDEDIKKNQERQNKYLLDNY